MRNWDSNEDQYRKWIPRRPSPELRQRIFGKPALAGAAARTISDFSRWLVPAFGCFVLVVGGLTQHVSEHVAPARETNLFSAQNGQKSRIMLAEARQHSEINALPTTRMERSIEGSPLPPPGQSTLISHTNQLIQQ